MRMRLWGSLATICVLGACAWLQVNTAIDPAPPPRERPDSPGARAAFDAARRLPPGVQAIDPVWYRQAESRARLLPAFNSRLGRAVNDEKTAAPWEWLGPSNVGGRTRTLVFDPRNPARMLAGGVSGGVFETTNGGQSWRPLSDDTVNLNIGALAIDPVAPDTLYAGTGELYRNSERPFAAMWGQGILKSEDGGQHWRQLLATDNADFRYVSDLVISPLDHRRMYAATNTGVWRSDDGGASFTQILRPTIGGGLQYEGCTDLELLPGSETLLASCASRSEDDRYWLPGTVVPPACGRPCPASVFRTDDARGTPSWQLVLSETGMGRTSLAVAPSNPNILYALAASTVSGPDRNGDGIGDYDNGLHALFRSDDGGRSWQARLRNTSADVLSTYLLSYADGFEAVRCGFGSFDAYSAGWYNQAIAVNPLDPEIVWVGGMEVYRSNDGGRSFGKASYWWLEDGGTGEIHADQHLLKFHPNYAQGTRILYSTNDGGVAYTDDDAGPVRTGATAACGRGSGVVRWTTIENGLGSVQFYTGTVSASGQVWMGGAQDNGTLLQNSFSAGNAFIHVFGGDGASVAIDPRSDNTLYVSYQNVNIHRSVDGVTFVRATNGINDATVFIMPFVLDTLAPNRLYAGGSRLWRTNDQGRNWVAASAALGGDFTDRISAIGLSPVNNNRILIGNQRAIFRSSSAGSTSGNTQFASVSPRSGWVSSLTFDPADANLAYATYSTFGGAHVWRSNDAGATWTAIDGVGAGALPDVPVHHIVVDPGNRQRLYIGTDIGVFVSLDGGQSWARENGGFANVIVERLAIGPGPAAGSPPHLYAFTYGRGAWRVPLASLDGVASYRIGADLSGSFYDPAHDGHGWFIEATNIGGVPGVVATWYTYLNGEQVWLVGAAPADGDSARVPLSITRGGQFPPAFDPASVVLEPWGEVLLRFDSANQGSATWTTSRSGFTNGSMPLVRLSGISAAAESAAALNACHSGTWYQPTQNGHGLQVQVIGPPGQEQLLAIWFAYLNGKQVWMLGAGPIQGDRATLPMTITRGAQFPRAFNPASVVREPWGTLSFRATGNDSARIEWQGVLPGYGSGGMDLVRLSTLLGRGCG